MFVTKLKIKGKNIQETMIEERKKERKTKNE